MSLFAIAIPVAPGKTAEFNAFIKELGGSRFAEFKASRKKLRAHERTFLQHTPMGDFVLVTLEGDDPAGAFEAFGKGNDAFTRWFKEQVKLVHGFDFGNPPAVELPKLIMDSGA